MQRTPAKAGIQRLLIECKQVEFANICAASMVLDGRAERRADTFAAEVRQYEYASEPRRELLVPLQVTLPQCRRAVNFSVVVSSPGDRQDIATEVLAQFSPTSVNGVVGKSEAPMLDQRRRQ